MKRVSGRRLILWIFCIGVLGGTLLANLLSGSYLSVLSDLVTAVSDLLEGFSGKDSGYFMYLLKLRGLPVLVLCCCLFTAYGNEALCVASAWYGFCTGAVISGAVLLWGAGGVLVFLAMIFPQYIFYVLIFLQLLTGYERVRTMRTTRAAQLSEEVSDFLLMAVLFLIGVLLEAYLNPILLKMAVFLV